MRANESANRCTAWLQRLEALPLFMCGLRPFFVLTAASAVAFMGIWTALLSGAAPAQAQWQLPGGIVVWHAHELIYGFGMAAVTGFLLTAVPEFTGCAPVSRRSLLVLVVLWLLGRLAYAFAPVLPSLAGLGLAAACNLAGVARLTAIAAPPLWRDPLRRNFSMALALAGLGLLQAGFFAALAAGTDPMPWLRAAVGLMMVLVILATSRISMRAVNLLLEEGRPGAPPSPEVGYVARPPRRQLAASAILLCSATEFVLGDTPVTGWLALAAACAMLNLLNDWHVGRALFDRWSLMLYGVYGLLAAGYLVMGVAWLGGGFEASAGRHLLMAGTMGLSILTVMSIAGRLHAGLWLDRRAWLPWAAAAIIGAALLRTTAALPAAGSVAAPLLLVAGGLWCAAFLAYACAAGPALIGPRNDGRTGCAEPERGGPGNS